MAIRRIPLKDGTFKTVQIDTCYDRATAEWKPQFQQPKPQRPVSQDYWSHT